MDSIRTFLEESEAFTRAILGQMPDLRKNKRKFILDCIFCFLSIQGRINFMQLGRFGKYSETTYRHHFQEFFDFMNFNQLIINKVSSRKGFIAFDPTYLPKSGKSTDGTGKFWSGVAGTAQWGLEFSGLAYVDTVQETAYSLESTQTPRVSDLHQEGKTLIDHYLQVIYQQAKQLEQQSSYLVADSYFAKTKFLDGLCAHTNLFLISKLRCDANARYLYEGKRKKGRGRPKQYDGKINWNKLDEKYAVLVDETVDYQLYELTIWAVKFKRKLKVSVLKVRHKNGEWKIDKLLFSTDLLLTAQQIYDWYRLRFQIEFLFRDAKQYTGLTHCQARNKKALHFHVNMALTAVNIAKAKGKKVVQKKGKISCSIRNVKQLITNQFNLNRFFIIFEIDPDNYKNKNTYNKCLKWGIRQH